MFDADLADINRTLEKILKAVGGPVDRWKVSYGGHVPPVQGSDADFSFCGPWEPVGSTSAGAAGNDIIWRRPMVRNK